MSSYTAVDVSQLPYPGIVEELSFENIYSEMRSQMNGLQPLLFNEQGQAVKVEAELVTDTNGDRYFRVPYAGDEKLLNLELESDPSAKQLQIVAYREMLLRQRVNEATKGVMLAYADDEDLDNIGANFGQTRLLISPADPENNIEAVYESNEEFRRRIQLVSESFSTAGPEAAYIYHTLGADGNVKDASATAPSFVLADIDQSIRDQLPSGAIVLICTDDVGLTDPMPGDVAVTVLSHDNNGEASEALKGVVNTALNADEVRPITDRVRVRGASNNQYSIDAVLYTYAGPDSDLVLQMAEAALRQYVDAHHRLGHDITLSGIYAALTVSGVQKVVLNNFNQDIVCTRYQAAYCTGITLTHGGVDE